MGCVKKNIDEYVVKSYGLNRFLSYLLAVESNFSVWMYEHEGNSFKK